MRCPTPTTGIEHKHTIPGAALRLRRTIVRRSGRVFRASGGRFFELVRSRYVPRRNVRVAFPGNAHNLSQFRGPHSVPASRSYSLRGRPQYAIVPSTGLTFMADGCTNAPAGVDPPPSRRCLPPWLSDTSHFFLSMRSTGLPLDRCYAMRRFRSMGCNPTWN